ncbi:GntR family transcriptional regulator [Sphingomonas aurantiaca]|uniref:GntR family transcriptional regulator n=1 Tax=Sphingomonas aurantiaca TaxID=185949 RepID=A0A2T5GIW6_9SPHN|nr:GntR family transcriptional regulator [Sphingomonas aurantiaca]PTQ59278.1 GntR family transcriptional regulator [Sphingomonas aurantiaca]
MADIDTEDTGLLSDRIRNALTDAISSGELAPGTTLDEQQLADRYGASRTPVREALRQLATSGMVEVRPRRGVIVRHVTAEEVMDMFEAMAEIEAVCVRLATYRITPLERSRLLRIHEASEAAVAAGDVDAYDALNREFHEAIYRAAHNDFLADQAIAVRTRLNAFRRMQLRQDRRLVTSRAEHDAVMRAIAEGDGDEAARRMRAHMLNAASALDSYIAHQDALHIQPAKTPG